MTNNVPGAWAYFRSLLPQGTPLPAGTWASRHRLILWLVAAHAFALAFYGLTRGWHPLLAIGEPAAIAAVAGLAAWPGTSQRTRSLLAALAVVASSAVFVQFSHGAAAAHAHYLVAIAFVALYHDWRVLGLGASLVVAVNAFVGTVSPGLVYADGHTPWQWALIEAVAVLAECAALLMFWSGFELARARTDLVLESAGEGIVGLDSSGTVTFANPAACALFGRRDLVGSGLRELMAGTSFTLDARHRTGTGALTTRARTVPVEWMVTPTLRAGVAIGSVMVIRDIASRRRLEDEVDHHRKHLEALVQRRTAELTEANRELEAFSYTVSHDLRSPLRAIGGFSAILARRHAGDLPEDSKQMLQLLRDGANRMGDLIESVLLLTRIGRGEIADEDVDLSALARDILQGLAEKTPGRRVEVHVEDGLACRGDDGLLRIALENLLGNAWKFTGRTERARIRFASTGRPGTFVVEDNGAGFDMALAHDLFQPFHRLHEPSDFEGTGVGLATVRRVVQRHGGTIRAESSPGEGARFIFTIPVEGEAPLATQARVRVLERPRRREREAIPA